MTSLTQLDPNYVESGWMAVTIKPSKKMRKVIELAREFSIDQRLNDSTTEDLH